MKKRNNIPDTISDIVSSIVKVKDLKSKADSVDFFPYWKEIVGAENFEFCKPIRLNKGILTVEAIDAAYVQELSLKQTEFKKKISELGYAGAVSSIKFISGNPKSIKERK